MKFITGWTTSTSDWSIWSAGSFLDIAPTSQFTSVSWTSPGDDSWRHLPHHQFVPPTLVSGSSYLRPTPSPSRQASAAVATTATAAAAAAPATTASTSRRSLCPAAAATTTAATATSRAKTHQNLPGIGRVELRVENSFCHPTNNIIISITITYNNCKCWIHCADSVHFTDFTFYISFSTFSYYIFHITDIPSECCTRASMTWKSTS